jgi:signal transduction histidine kinase
MADGVVSLRIPVSAETRSRMAAFHRGQGGSDDIHDAVRRRLAEALRRLEHADDCLDDDPDRAGRLIRSALAYAKIGDAELQTAIARIYLRVLTDDGLAPAVTALARLFTMSTTVDVDPRRFAQPVEAAAYLLIAETLTTVHEQSEANRVHVAAYSAGANLAVEVSYDGADAFGADRTAELRRRVEAFDATLAIVTQAGIGTRVRAMFPRASALS